MIEAYLKYKSMGLACLPTSKEKTPAIPKGESWAMGWNNKAEYEVSFGIGIACGSASGSLECIDIDNHFGDAKQVLSDLIQIDEVNQIYNKHKFPIQSTTSGGFHLLYKCTVIGGNLKLANRPKYDQSLRKFKKDVLIETRGEGGYFCVEPTPGYRIFRNSIEKIPHITPEEREILMSACRSFNTVADVRKKEQENNDLPGSMFNNDPSSIDEMKRALRENGWTEPREDYWLRPGKKKGISATMGKVAPGVFYNFSSSGDPFENEHAYSAFQVITLLKYNGDFSLCAKDLAKRYSNNTTPIPVTSEKKEEKTPNQYDEIIRKSYIDTDIPVAKPPIIMRIKAKMGSRQTYTRVLTLGNFSAVIGKSKAKKSYLATMFLACATRKAELDYTFLPDLPSSRPGVVLFDTEQSNYDAYISAKRVCDLSGKNKENFGSFDLREYSPIERCNIINHFIETKCSGVSFIVIDGIADLATAINDEIEASRVVSLLMKWTKIHNIHIMVILHQNKNDNFATGHLGSLIMKKAECVMSVTKDPSDSSRSEIACDYIRGTMEFDKFTIAIDESGMPKVEDIFKANEKSLNYYE